MTATTVNGQDVITAVPATAPITTRDGDPILFKQTMRLLLADGSEVFGCIHCDYTHASLSGVRPHLKVHAGPKPPKTTGGGRSMTLDQLVAAVARLGEVEADRDRWKSRAVKAEKSLTTLRNALKG